MSRPSPTPVEAASRPGPGPLLAAGVVLVVHLALTELCAGMASPVGRWLGLLVPSCWLAAATAVILRRAPTVLAVAAPGPRRRHMGVFCAILALLFLLVVLMGATLGGSGAEAARRNLWSVVPLLLLAPAAEELYFRGLLLDHLTRRFGPGAAICFVSGLFGLVHWPQGHA